MLAGPTLIQILFYIAALLAPADATKITLSVSPTEALHFTKTAAGSWQAGTDDSELKIDGDFLLVHPAKEGGKDERVKVATFVGDAPDAAKSLKTHDWTKEKSLKLSRGLTIEKSDGGFVVHTQKSADSPLVDLHIIYGK